MAQAQDSAGVQREELVVEEGIKSRSTSAATPSAGICRTIRSSGIGFFRVICIRKDAA
jgi:hypothetical protein